MSATSSNAAAGVAEQLARVRAAVPPAGAIAVSVPATSANLGPGYDVFGIALDVPLLAVAVPRGDETQRVTVSGFGEGELAGDEDNLVWRGVLAWCEHAGTAVPDVAVTVHSAIPLERGMGSSSAAAIAGIMLGRALTGGGTGGIAELVDLAVAFEGHPDNAIAALVGGLVVCLPDGGYRRMTPDAALRPVLVVPVSRQSTNEARAALPANVPLALAAENVALSAAVLAGLAGLAPLTADVMIDHLHEPARLALMPDSGSVVAALRAAGIPAALSGAGPSVLAVVAAHDPAEVARVEAVVAETRPGSAAEVLPSSWHLSGATVRSVVAPS